MVSQFRAIKEALCNAINIRRIIDDRIRRELVCLKMSENASIRTDNGISDELYDGRELIISLTTYNKRIFQVHVVIESLLEQNVRPNRIILWLDKDEFKSTAVLPINLQRLQNRGLQIEFCDNLKSYKKLIPALLQYPDAIIITADDDIIYPNDFVERLYNSYLKHPDRIHYYRGHKMLIENGRLKPYKTWELETNCSEPSFMNFPTGGAGALYTSELVNSEITNINAFMNLAPYADDIWFKAMSLMNNVQCEQVQLECPFREKFIFIDTMDDMGLAKINLGQNKNDEQLYKVFEQYNLFEKLK